MTSKVTLEGHTHPNYLKKEHGRALGSFHGLPLEVAHITYTLILRKKLIRM